MGFTHVIYVDIQSELPVQNTGVICSKYELCFGVLCFGCQGQRGHYTDTLILTFDLSFF